MKFEIKRKNQKYELDTSYSRFKSTFRDAFVKYKRDHEYFSDDELINNIELMSHAEVKALLSVLGVDDYDKENASCISNLKNGFYENMNDLEKIFNTNTKLLHSDKKTTG